MDDTAAYKANYKCHEPGITPEEVAKNYTEWAHNYDETLCPGRYNGPDIAANEIASRVPEDRRQHVKVIDVAAGTGRVGLLLKDKGFTNVDALEPSVGMMDLLKKTGVYSNTYLEFLGVGQNSVPDDTYDYLLIAGGMGEGHIPVKGVDDMVRMVKPDALMKGQGHVFSTTLGDHLKQRPSVEEMLKLQEDTIEEGLVIIVMRKEYLDYVAEYKDRLVPHIDLLEQKGKWSKVELKTVPNYSFSKDGLVFTYKVL